MRSASSSPLSDAALAQMEYLAARAREARQREGTAVARPIRASSPGPRATIGCGIVEALLEHGACVLASDIDGERLDVAMRRFARAPLAIRNVRR
jgi:hypothetical protein